MQEKPNYKQPKPLTDQVPPRQAEEAHGARGRPKQQAKPYAIQHCGAGLRLPTLAGARAPKPALAQAPFLLGASLGNASGLLGGRTAMRLGQAGLIRQDPSAKPSGLPPSRPHNLDDSANLH
jgi:hypothetical protein